MLTPKFDLSQDDEYLAISICCPFAKVTETEIFIDQTEFKFYSSPYYLRLTLPGCVIEDDRASAKYDADKGKFVVKVAKVTKGEHFDGLDMITRLLAPAGAAKVPSHPSIEVLDTEPSERKDEEFNWFIDQQPCDSDESISLDGPKYGFAEQRSGVFKHLQSEMIGLVDLPEPDSTPANERASLREVHEQCHFDENHYLADLYEADATHEVMSYQPWWTGQIPTENLSEEEKEQMLKLPRKEYILDSAETTSVCLGLVDILLAFCYDYRTTLGEHNKFSSSHDVVTAFVRRAITYPLYRNWALAQTVVRDVCRLLAMGRKAILKCLLSIRHLLQDCDMRYVLNDLYITDYCVWIQSASNDQLQSLSEAVKQVGIISK